MKLGRLPSLTEEQIIKGCVREERKAQQALYARYSPKMFSICLRYCNDYHSAEDVLQEGFIKVFRYISRFRHEGSFEGWMRRIFVNTSIEHLRRSVNMYPIVDDENKPIEILDPTAYDLLDEQDLLNMIQELSPGYRTVFNLYVVEGYSHKEISAVLDISEGTSKSQLARARQLLQKKVEANSRLPMGGAS